MTPASWYEVDRPPVPKSTRCICGHGAVQHVLGRIEPERRMECTESGPRECRCERYVSAADICEACNGVGVLGDVRRSDYDGRKCTACGGAGYVEHYEEGEPA